LRPSAGNPKTLRQSTLSHKSGYCLHGKNAPEVSQATISGLCDKHVSALGGPFPFSLPDSADAAAQQGGDEPIAEGWTVVSMKDDWKTIYPPTGKDQAAAP